MYRWLVLYLTGEELSINAHQPTQPKKRPSQNHYQNPANLLPPPFGSTLSASPSVGSYQAGPTSHPTTVPSDFARKIGGKAIREVYISISQE